MTAQRGIILTCLLLTATTVTRSYGDEEDISHIPAMSVSEDDGGVLLLPPRQVPLGSADVSPAEAPLPAPLDEVPRSPLDSRMAARVEGPLLDMPEQLFAYRPPSSSGCCAAKPRIHHVRCGLFGRLRSSGKPTLHMVLLAKDPTKCCDCVIQIPVCISGCCTDTPKVSGGRGLLGRGFVDYRWRCGAMVRVVFRKCGDIIVHYYGC
jgi:hypothetical protein